jgi:lysophospholipase L1-like esterase
VEGQGASLRAQPKIAIALLLLAACSTLPAQQPVSAPLRDAYRASRASKLMDDFGELSRYRDDDAKLGPAKPGEKRVVFLGDSITDGWKLDQYFPGKGYINRGISGQTTSQMLLRFRQDVINLKPKVVVVLAGTNDIAGNTGPISLEDIESNYAGLAELAKAHGIQVVFSSILPVHNYADTPKAKEFYSTRSMDSIRKLNEWLKGYCAQNRLVYLDYFSAVVDDKGMLRRELANDGLHPNDAGYKIMVPLAQKAIEQALSRK